MIVNFFAPWCHWYSPAPPVHEVVTRWSRGDHEAVTRRSRGGGHEGGITRSQLWWSHGGHMAVTRRSRGGHEAVVTGLSCSLLLSPTFPLSLSLIHISEPTRPRLI
eukprot:2421338-Rhodomonas_salina.1